MKIAVLLIVFVTLTPVYAQDTTTPIVNIHLAALQGNVDAIKKHVAAGSDLNEKDAFGSTPLRHALVEASINAIRRSPDLSRLYHRILYRSNIQKARVAVARKLAVIIYAMLNRSEPFRMETT